LSQAVFDHVAIGTTALTDGWDLFGGLLGGSWVYGGDSPGFWWGQLEFSTGPKIELLTPSGGPDAGFLERFLDARGAGAHHFNFVVPDIHVTLSRVRAVGIEPIQVNVASPTWKEAFLHPKNAYGIVVQVAQPSGPPPTLPPPAELPVAGPTTDFALVEHQVGDIDGAIRLFADALGGEVDSREQTARSAVADLTWVNGARLRLVQPVPGVSGAAPRPDDGLCCLRFTRHGVQFTDAERRQAADLAGRLGVPLQLAD
jgi:methylmalonyl-CoA/ethylmalonyl-CoA epimerase